MKKPKMTYFEEKDVLHLLISEEDEAGSVELSPNITAEWNDKGDLIGIEILNASTYIRYSILETAQAEVLSIASSQSAPTRKNFTLHLAAIYSNS
jgi:uncharacterized protein YuzE